jgi:hypothetical protein
MVVNGLDHLEPAYRAIALKTDEERIAWIKADRWIGFDQAQQALDRLDALIAYPPRDRMPCLLLYGATGMGKTKILRKFERLRPPRYDQKSGVAQRDLVVVQTPPEPVEADLYRELLAALGAPALIGGALAREKDACRALLRASRARMIVLDEVNGMLAGTFRQQRIFLNALRFLANDLKVALVCAGTDLARQALLSDAQLAERFEAFHLAPWRNDLGLARLLRAFGAILPLRKPSELENPAIRGLIFDMTDGVTARIFRLIETVAERAILSGKERIDAESFADRAMTLPLVAMTRSLERRGEHAHRA